VSRHIDHSDDDSPEMVLAQGRWERNARATLKGKRGRRALAEIRGALLALPDKRLIEGALCTVGGPERVPEVTDTEVDEHVARLRAAGLRSDHFADGETVRWMRQDREDEREAIGRNVEDQGCGVCVNGALLWHRLVKGGMTPEGAFAMLPSIVTDDSDPLSETARITERDAGIAYTLAWELAYRNDETYGRMTPEERYTAFLAWIDAELGDTPASATEPTKTRK
jgi:hypothetical protein